MCNLSCCLANFFVHMTHTGQDSSISLRTESLTWMQLILSSWLRKILFSVIVKSGWTIYLYAATKRQILVCLYMQVMQYRKATKSFYMIKANDTDVVIVAIATLPPGKSLVCRNYGLPLVKDHIWYGYKYTTSSLQLAQKRLMEYSSFTPSVVVSLTPSVFVIFYLHSVVKQSCLPGKLERGTCVMSCQMSSHN